LHRVLKIKTVDFCQRFLFFSKSVVKQKGFKLSEKFDFDIEEWQMDVRYACIVIVVIAALVIPRRQMLSNNSVQPSDSMSQDAGFDNTTSTIPSDTVMYPHFAEPAYVPPELINIAKNRFISQYDSMRISRDIHNKAVRMTKGIKQRKLLEQHMRDSAFQNTFVR